MEIVEPTRMPSKTNRRTSTQGHQLEGTTRKTLNKLRTEISLTRENLRK